MHRMNVALFSVFAVLFSLSSLALGGNPEFYTAAPGETKVIDLGPGNGDVSITLTLNNKTTKPLSVELAVAMGLILVGLEIDGKPMKQGCVNSKSITVMSAEDAKVLGFEQTAQMEDSDLLIVEEDYHEETTYIIIAANNDKYDIKTHWQNEE